ncbi:unnamed protein product [Diamesa serratosioi]
MSFTNHQQVINKGDTAIVYISINNMHAIEITPTIVNKHGEVCENVFQTTYGALKVKTLIGKSFGSKLELSRGYAYILQPNAELWTQTLPHRTQILYTPDISMILFQLEIQPGKIVIEAGTGSGSLSHYFIRAVKENGHLYTFDFHKDRVEQARDEFEKHGLGNFVTVQHRDVCSGGFTDELDQKADAVFLDLPAPHLAVEFVVKVLKQSGGRFCSFSPCIEQTQACCLELEKNGFLEVHTIEILQSEHIVKEKPVPILDLSFVKTKREPGENSEKKAVGEVKKVLTTFTPPILQGHTGYLTFATLPSIAFRDIK